MNLSPFWAALAGGAAFCVVLAVAGGLLTRLTSWYHDLRKPAWKPPDWAFGPIWTVVFGFLSTAIAYAWTAEGSDHRTILVALAINGVLNMAWSGIFFTLQNPTAALVELFAFWLSILAVIWVFSAASSTAALLTLPYIAWVTAAGVLNFQIIRLNPA